MLLEDAHHQNSTPDETFGRIASVSEVAKRGQRTQEKITVLCLEDLTLRSTEYVVRIHKGRKGVRLFDSDCPRTAISIWLGNVVVSLPAID